MTGEAYVVVRSVGEYSDRQESPIIVLTTEEAAKEFVTAASEQWRATLPLFPHLQLDDYGFTYEEGDRLKADRLVRAAKHAAVLTFDPDAATIYEGDIPSYHYSKVRVAAVSPPAIDWQPIPNSFDPTDPHAPFDGSEYLLYTDSATVDVVRLGWWNDGGNLFDDTKYVADIGWWSYKHSVTQEHLTYLKPSHWAKFTRPEGENLPYVSTPPQEPGK